MAFIECPECGKDISDKAHACPHCGCPYKGRGIRRRFSRVEIAIMIVAAAVVMNLVLMLLDK